MTKNSLLEELRCSLHYLKVAELKELCLKLKIPPKGQKPQLIKNIMSFLQYGKVNPILATPPQSKAQKGKSYPLTPNTVILKGNYKNDAKTRAFFKSLIGEYFHFTAFGQDWIKQRWMEGNPPTYQEFASFWEEENQARKTRKAEPKQEWAYLNFIQSYLAKHPNSPRQEIADAWKVYREEQVAQANQILQSVLNISISKP